MAIRKPDLTVARYSPLFYLANEIAKDRFDTVSKIPNILGRPTIDGPDPRLEAIVLEHVRTIAAINNARGTKTIFIGQIINKDWPKGPNIWAPLVGKGGFPSRAAAYCLESAGLSTEEIDFVVFYDKPFLKFERLFKTYLAFAPRGVRSFARSFPVWLKEKLFQKNVIVEALKDCLGGRADWKARLRFSEHHVSHAASAFFPSPFEEAAILTMDGVGERVTTSVFTGRANQLAVHKEIHFPHSLGLLYSAFTFYTGFKVNSGEYKVMGLAPYGEPRYVDLITRHLIDIKEDGSFHLDMRYFDYCTGLTMTNERFHALFGGPPRNPESQLTQREMDIAASIQVVTEDIFIKLSKDVQRTTHQKNFCLAGGVALNCVANGRLLREGVFENIWIQPAAGDAGGAIGAALAVYYLMLNRPRPRFFKECPAL